MSLSVETGITTSVVSEGVQPIDMSERDSRQREFLPPEMLANVCATVIGVGAVGRQAALQLAAVGVKSLWLYDHDTVDVVNLANQGFAEADLGFNKAVVVSNQARVSNGGLKVKGYASRFDVADWKELVFSLDDDASLTPEVYDGKAIAGTDHMIFCCVDSLAARRQIWDQVKAMPNLKLWIDARMLGETLYVYAVRPTDARQVAGYEASLTEKDLTTGRCTAKSTIYAANIIAGLQLNMMSHWLRGFPVQFETQLSLGSLEMSTSDAPDLSV